MAPHTPILNLRRIIRRELARHEICISHWRGVADTPHFRKLCHLPTERHAENYATAIFVMFYRI